MWNDLTMSERASVIKMAVKAGLRDMKSIRDFYDKSLSGNSYEDGGPIHISPSKRGTFTAAATKHGMGVQEFASRVLANKDDYSPAMIKKANFAKNASKWKHDLGGYLFEEGGPKNTNREYKSANSWSTANINKALRPITEPLSRDIMNIGRSMVFDGDLSPNSELNYGTPQDTYLLPKNIQRDIFLEKGYTEVPNDYGLVKKAVGNRNIPVYQRRPDNITRDKVIPIGNINNNWEGSKEAELENPGAYPTAIYYSPETSKYYQKGWDLNDYGGDGQAYNSVYRTLERLQADLIDKIGSPVVTTTGISEIGDTNKIIKNPLLRTKVEDFLKTKGLVLTDMSRPLSEEERKWAELGLLPYNPNGNYVPSLPEVTITGKRRKKVK